MGNMTRRDMIRIGLAGSVAQAVLPRARVEGAGGPRLTMLFEGLCLYHKARPNGVEVVLMPAPDHKPFLALLQTSLQTPISAFGTGSGALFSPIPSAPFYEFSLDQVNVSIGAGKEIASDTWPSLDYTRQCGCAASTGSGTSPWKDLGWITHFDVPFPKNKGLDLTRVNYFSKVTLGKGALEGASPSGTFRGLWTWEAYDSTQQIASNQKTGYISGPPQSLTNVVRYIADLAGNGCTIQLSQKNGTGSFKLNLSNNGADIALLLYYKMQNATSPAPSDRLLHYQTFYDALTPLGLQQDLRPIPVLVSSTACGTAIESDLRESERLFQKLIDGSIGCPGGSP